MKLKRLFCTPLLTFELAEAPALNREVLAVVSRMRDSEQGVQRSNVSGWHSSSKLFHTDEPCLARLSEFLIECCYQATEKIANGFERAHWKHKLEAWVNVNPAAAMNVPHVHPGYFWSGCYYVSVPEDSSDRGGCIEFIAPRPGQGGPAGIDSSFFKLKHRVRPQPGQLLLFPAWLTHWVYPNLSADERVSVAFNLRFKKA